MKRGEFLRKHRVRLRRRKRRMFERKKRRMFDKRINFDNEREEF